MMDIEVEFDGLGMSDAAERRAWDARAKITWGDPPDRVRAELVAHGVDDLTADEIVRLCLRERAADMRVRGLRDLVFGLLALAGSAAVAVATYAAVRGVLGIPLPGKGAAFLWAGSFLAFMYGLHLTWHGVDRLVSGARASGPVRDVDDRTNFGGWSWVSKPGGDSFRSTT
jgi:hypothetical protein